LKLLFLDLFPAYIPFIVQCTKAAGDKIDPTVDNLIVYEEGGADATFDSTQITGSPFDPAKVNAKTGLWGVLIPKTAFTAGKFYLALWEITVDTKTTAKIERYFACNAAQFKAAGFAVAGDAMTLTSTYDAAKTAAAPGAAMALTSGERTTLTGVIWNALLSGFTTVGSIGKKLADWVLGNDNKALISTDAQDLSTTLKVDAKVVEAAVALATSQPNYAPAKAGDAMTLTSEYNRAKTALADTEYTAPYNIGIANIITYIQNVLTRLGDFAGSTPNDVMGFLKAIMRKDEGILPSQVGGTFDNQTDSLQALRDNPVGGGGGGTIILPVMEGAVYSALAVQDKEVNIVRGDTPTIFFDLHGNYTGWTAKFGAKVKPKDTGYIIPVKNCTWTDASVGQGYFELTSTETANEAKLAGEIELTKDTKHLTAMRFILRIIEDVIK